MQMFTSEKSRGGHGHALLQSASPLLKSATPLPKSATPLLDSLTGKRVAKAVSMLKTLRSSGGGCEKYEMRKICYSLTS